MASPEGKKVSAIFVSFLSFRLTDQSNRKSVEGGVAWWVGGGARSEGKKSEKKIKPKKKKKPTTNEETKKQKQTMMKGRVWRGRREPTSVGLEGRR